MVNIELTERQSLSIGREADNDVVLTDHTVSRYHAVLRAVEGHHYLCDRGSTNGTFLGGQRIQDAEVQAGDVVRFGDAEVRLTGAAEGAVVRGRARCSRTGQSFGVRYEKHAEGWHIVGVFALDARRAQAPIFKDSAIEVISYARYPGCPHCGATGIVHCGCDEVSCCGTFWRKHICPWCGNSKRPVRRNITVAGAMDQG
jgi:hypothetical protein